ncbi:MAG TPA: VOC family protein [Ramlibacter sp.]|nr:VOC family protein [Ramlibacter sp.]
MSYHPGKFIWFEHLSSDPAKARKFYEALFGWNLASLPMGEQSYDMIKNGEQGIGGMLKAPPGVPNQWVSYLSVMDVDASYKAALAAGAKSTMEPKDFPPVGRGAAILDPTGAAVSLWKTNEGDRDDQDDTPAGDWVWNELMTPDVAKALAFYERVFGYTHDEMDGLKGKYYILKSADGKGRAGVMQVPHAGAPAMWMPYVRVKQADATAARVQPLGGELMMQPQDIPNVGRICALFDPLHAALGFIQPATTM